MFQELPNEYPSLPESIMTASQDELTDIKIKLKEIYLWTSQTARKHDFSWK